MKELIGASPRLIADAQADAETAEWVATEPVEGSTKGEVYLVPGRLVDD